MAFSAATRETVMGAPPEISVLIPWYERDELRLTLAANAPVFRALKAEVMVLNCGGNRERLRALIAASEEIGVRQLDIPAPRFNKALALNVGLSRSRSDSILTLDADVALLGDAFAESKALTEDPSFVTIEWVYESEPATSGVAKEPSLGDNLTTASEKGAILELRFRNGTKVRHQLSRRDVFGSKRSGPGLLFARKCDLLEIGGFNSELQTWGWEDDDVLVRLQYVLNLRRVQKGEALHLTHGDDRRALGGTRSQSDQLNFIRCCRNYNKGLFLGTYHADVAWVTDRVAEAPPPPDVVTTALPGQIVHCAPDYKPSYLSGPEYCGHAVGMRVESRPVWRKPPASIDELLLEATIRKGPLQDLSILHVGIGNSGLAIRLSPYCRHITGVTLEEAERSVAIDLGLQNYHVVVGNKYSDGFGRNLPLDAYDIIVDHRIADHACCRHHLKVLMENYSRLLAPKGRLVTTQHGLARSATNSGWKLNPADLARLGGEFGCVAKTGYGVYTLKRR